MEFQKLLQQCPPADRANIQYFTKDAFGEIYAHTLRPYTMDKHWRSPEGEGLYIGRDTEDAEDWQASLIARPSRLGPFEAPLYAAGAAAVIVAMVWVYSRFIV